jgi:hypothetical protein
MHHHRQGPSKFWLFLGIILILTALVFLFLTP